MKLATSGARVSRVAPARRTLDFGSVAALSVDVEEWYHSCWVEEYVEPSRRQPLTEELDRLLPALLERLARAPARATFFFLGEVARRLPESVRAVAAAGHEVACHGDLHLRANERAPEAFRRDLESAKARLEDLVGARISGFRAPEWSLRSITNPRLRIVAELGFRYDSSLAPAWGSGSTSNPIRPTLLTWADGVQLVELPPLTWGARLRLPACGWSGRLLGAAGLARVARRAMADGRLPLLVVHPWEVVARPCPGVFTGFARFFHDAGRHAFAESFDELLRLVPLPATLARRSAELGLDAGATLRGGAMEITDFGLRVETLA
jgi:peptidoglycan/xylan/chitin deacetylase (PgdA/CDA1 family)